MSGDPLEESGQQVRQGIVQALQTAHTTAALMRGRGGDSRSRSEHEQRVAHADNREARSRYEHTVRVDTEIFEAESKVSVNDARVEEIRGRMAINEQAQQLSQRETEARMGRADQDLARRDRQGHQQHQQNQDVTDARVEEIRARMAINEQAQQLSQRETEAKMGRADQDLANRERLGHQQYRQNQEVHTAKIGGYKGRETRAEILHDLDVEYKKLLIDIRRRAAGFTETLSGDGDIGQSGASAAAFAAADAERDLSEDHAYDADAYERRFAEDTGRAFADVIDAETVDIDFDAATDGRLDAESDVDAEPEYPLHVSLDAVRGLAEELTAEIHIAYMAAALVDPDPDPTPAEAIDDAMGAALGDGIGESPQAVGASDLDPGGTDVSFVTAPGPDL